jgi:hypothetical protein
MTVEHLYKWFEQDVEGIQEMIDHMISLKVREKPIKDAQQFLQERKNLLKIIKLLIEKE